MELVSIVVIGGMVVASFLYSLMPFVRSPEAAGVVADEEGGTPADREISRLLVERDRAYRNIQEIEFDKEMGKLSEADYAEMIGPARSRALDLLRRLEARGVREGMVGLRLSEREAAQAAQALAAAPSAPAPAPAAGEGLDRRLEEEILRYRKTAPARPEEAPAPAVGFCPSCGVAVAPGHNFCAACGHKLR